MNPHELNQYITNYINYTISYQKELEADTYGARLLKASGYGKEGFIYWFQFSMLLEEMLGMQKNSTRTHPTAEVRIENINRVWDENSSPYSGGPDSI
ncbi:MAG: M48 family metalloprotease [Candidatus Xenobiia bacterium LiM19]